MDKMNWLGLSENLIIKLSTRPSHGTEYNYLPYILIFVKDIRIPQRICKKIWHVLVYVVF